MASKETTMVADITEGMRQPGRTSHMPQENASVLSPPETAMVANISDDSRPPGRTTNQHMSDVYRSIATQRPCMNPCQQPQDELDQPPSSATTAHSSEVLTISSDSPSPIREHDDASSSDVEILETTPRRRPPTRATPNFGPVPYIRGPTQYGLPISETDVDVHHWHISRTKYRGAGPACSAATPGRHAPRALCKKKIRTAGYPCHGVGVVSPTFVGTSTFLGIQRPCRFWFCPNGKCHKGPGGPNCRSQMIHSPAIFPIARGTRLVQEEVDYLTSQGFLLVNRRGPFRSDQEYPDEAERKILVEAYPEKVDNFPRTYRFSSRNGKGCRRKLTVSSSCDHRLQRVRSSDMRLSHNWAVTEGNSSSNVEVLRYEILRLTEESQNLREVNDAQAEKIRKLLTELRDHNTEHPKALRQILILTMDLEHSRISERNATKELSIFRDDFKDRADLLDCVLAEKAYFTTQLSDIYKSFMEDLDKISPQNA
ncbi:hypothetical protein R1sor_005203 [Riccia sorocarpa]|uniref:Uncharacterized protein n=1 Tax=Riccia sorocarpa TaxID=122646 RepID=A0ABD3HLV0_9MARC